MTMATEVRERPVLFSGPMVRAILEGRKTQTRRVMLPQPVGFGPIGGLKFPVKGKRGTYDCLGGPPLLARCPYGRPGDRLWVREAWNADFEIPGEDGPVPVLFGEAPSSMRGAKNARYLYYRADQAMVHAIGADLQPWEDRIVEDEPDEWPAWLIEQERERRASMRWRPSIHMPRWASRITLEITEVRVERLQEITEEDARAEGISVLPLQDAADPSAWWQCAPGEHQARTARGAFARLWDSLNAERGYSFDSSPWVWVIGFRVLEVPHAR